MTEPSSSADPRPVPQYSQTDYAYVRRKRRIHVEEEEAGELNIVPYLDILINLILFLLVVQATMVNLGMIDVSAPTYAAAGSAPGPRPADDPKALERLTIGIAQQGFYIAAKGGVLPGESAEAAPVEITQDAIRSAPPTVALGADGQFDFSRLSAKLRGIKNAFPNSKAVFIVADPSIPYEIIVRTLDASREDARGPLFPQPTFAQMR